MKKFFENLALSVAALIVLFMVLEIVFRILGQPVYNFQRNDSHFIQPDSLLNYRYLAGLNTEVSTVDYSNTINTNSFGYRDDEWTFLQEENKILVVGNSFSVGFGLPEEQRWSDLLEMALNENNSSSRVYNAAVSGYSLEQALTTAEYLSPIIEPDMVILGLFIYGLNRLDNPFVYFNGFSVRKDKLDYAKIYKDELFILHFQNPGLQTIETLLYKHSVLYNFVVSRLGVIKDKLSPPPETGNSVRTDRALSLLHDFSIKMKDENRKLVVLPILSHNQNFEFDPAILESYRQIEAFCNSEGILFIDLFPALENKVASGPGLWINNDPHWNAEAHKLAAELLYEKIVN